MTLTNIVTDAGTDLWYTRCPVPSATSVAITRGWLSAEFADGPIRVRSIGESADPNIRLTHYTHQHPALFREGGVVPPLWAYATTGANALLGIARVSQSQGFISLRTSGIHSPEQLRGARIALPNRPTSTVDFSRAVTLQGIVTTLNAAGLDETAVRLVNVNWDEPFLSLAAGPAQASVYTARENVRLHSAEVLALVRGEVDAIFVAGPHGLALAALIDAIPVPGLYHDWESDRWEGNHLRVLTTSRELLDTRPDDVAQYVLGILRAAQWAQDHVDETWRIIAAEVGVAEEWAIAAYHPQTVSRLSPETSEGVVDALQQRSDFLFDRGFLPTPVDVRDWLDPRPLDVGLSALGPAGTRP